MEAVLLPGHTPGQCGYYDHQNHTIFIGDMTGIATALPNEPYAQYCTVQAMNTALKKLQPRFDEIEGVFPGHGMLDQSSLMLQYLLDATEAILTDPDGYDMYKEITVAKGERKKVMMKYVYQGTGIKYTKNNVR